MPTPRRIGAALASVLLFVSVSPFSRADTPPPDGAKASPAASKSGAPETYQAIASEFETASREFSKAYSSAKDDAERQKLVNEKYPRAETYAPRFVEFAKASPDDPTAVDALVWVASRTYNGAEHDEALKLLSTRYVESDKLQQACQRLAYSQSPAASDALRAIAEKNPNKQVKAYAAFALGQHYMNREKAAEAEKAFEDVAAKYADVASFRGTLGEAAKANLHEIRDLAVGKVAPEIEGVDVDGKTMKLSQYRGKVVVLDFWGDW
jgi:hypothetical protein